MYAVDAPRNATTHIQNTALGPPKPIAAATPAILPVPTLPDSETASAWNEEMPSSDSLLENNSRIISRNMRAWTNRVSSENSNPAPSSSQTSAGLQI